MHNVDIEQSPRAIHLFAGAGGGLLGGVLLGWRTVCAVELDSFCREVLVARQNDRTLAPFPIWDDVRTFDGRPWQCRCDVLCGGFPCQNISPLGSREGVNGAKSGLWKEFKRIANEIHPTLVFVENSSDLVKLGLDVVLRDLDEIGYDAEWMCLSAAELGAPHIRDRIWLLAKARDAGLLPTETGTGAEGGGDKARRNSKTPEEGVRVLPDTYLQRLQKFWCSVATTAELHSAELQSEDTEGRDIRLRWWQNEPAVHRVADGVANQLDRLMALGNGQSPAVAARAFSLLLERFATDNRLRA